VRWLATRAWPWRHREFIRQVCKFKLAKQLIRCGPIRWPPFQLIQIEMDLDIVLICASSRDFESDRHCRAETRDTFMFDFFPMLECAFDRTYSWISWTRPWVHAWRAGNVIDGITIKPSKSTSLFAGTRIFFSTQASSHHSMAGTGSFRLMTCEFCRNANNQRIAHQLAHVLIVGNDHGLQVFFGRLRRQRADYVISFEPETLIMARCRLRTSALCKAVATPDRRHFLAIGFVISESFVAKSFLFRLKNRRDVFRLFVLDKFPQHVGEDKNRLRHLTFRVRQRRCPISRAAHRKRERY